MTDELSKLIAGVVADAFGVEAKPVFTRPEEQHGDFATNVALQLAGQVGKPPREIAETIESALAEKGYDVSIAGPGFINIRLKDADLFALALNAFKLPQPLKDQVIVAEYSDPNPFKILHGGHLYTSLVGDAIANILQAAGGEVHRVNFGGDVGLHVAKTMWAIRKEIGTEIDHLPFVITDEEKLNWISNKYIEGNTAYEENPQAKQEIDDLNKQIYEMLDGDELKKGSSQIALYGVWSVCRSISYAGFELLYERLGMVPFEKYYPESKTAGPGLEAVQEGLKNGTFKESDGAIVYDKQAPGLHTRVFVNSAGLPTYETKDLGLALMKWQDYKFDRSIIITGDDIKDYMRVVMSAVGELNEEIYERSLHLRHGQLKLEGGVKMSSRLGNILRADDILDSAFEAAKKGKVSDDSAVVLGAVRYSFLKNRIGGDIIYSPEESVSLEGNSGPYLQYALVRARSILAKIEDIEPSENVDELDQAERSLARAISLYPEAFSDSLADYSPHHIANYLYELAVTFNRFYEQSRVIGHERAPQRAALVRAYEKTLANGLSLLGMPQPEKM